MNIHSDHAALGFGATDEATLVARELTRGRRDIAAQIAAALVSPGQSFDLRGGGLHGDVDEILLVLGRGDPGDCPNLGITELTAASDGVFIHDDIRLWRYETCW